MLKIWEKIDKFYLLYSSVLVVMACITIYTFRVIFQSAIEMNAVGEEEKQESTRVNQTMLDEAYNFIFEKNPTKLQVK